MDKKKWEKPEISEATKTWEACSKIVREFGKALEKLKK